MGFLKFNDEMRREVVNNVVENKEKFMHWIGENDKLKPEKVNEISEHVLQDTQFWDEFYSLIEKYTWKYRNLD